MKYIKKFSNHSSYELFKLGREFVKPNLSLCIEEDELHYTQYIKPYYKFGDILYENIYGGTKITSNILDPSEGYIPIGLCLAPTDFFGIGEKARFMSLKNMSCNDPDNGTTDISLSLNSPAWLCLGYKDFNISEINDITYIYKDIQSISRGYNVPIYDSNNNWNLSVLGEVNKYAATDIDGKNKTNIILRYATSPENWKINTIITNNANSGNYPAVCCCWRYHTISTQQGDWYLGAAGEMLIILHKKSSINNILNNLNSLYPNNCIHNLVEHNYWTSTEFFHDNVLDEIAIGIDDSTYRGFDKSINYRALAMLQY